jgi:hypothetical protein
MSDTPRTDAAILSWAEFTDEGYGPSKYVHVDDMRALERDLIKAKQAISESRNSDLIRSRTDAIMEANALTEEVARLRGYAEALERTRDAAIAFYSFLTDIDKFKGDIPDEAWIPFANSLTGWLGGTRATASIPTTRR